MHRQTDRQLPPTTIPARSIAGVKVRKLPTTNTSMMTDKNWGKYTKSVQQEKIMLKLTDGPGA